MAFEIIHPGYDGRRGIAHFLEPSVPNGGEGGREEEEK